MRRRRYFSAAIVVVALLTSGCAKQASTPDSTAPAQAGAEPVTVERTGGIAGRHDTVVVRPGGEWTRTDRAGARSSGQLTAPEQRELRSLLADPRLPDEARRPAVSTNCRDAFNYRLTVGTMKIGYVDCPSDADLPAASMAIVALIESATNAR